MIFDPLLCHQEHVFMNGGSVLFLKVMDPALFRYTCDYSRCIKWLVTGYFILRTNLSLKCQSWTIYLRCHNENAGSQWGLRIGFTYRWPQLATKFKIELLFPVSKSHGKYRILTKQWIEHTSKLMWHFIHAQINIFIRHQILCFLVPAAYFCTTQSIIPGILSPGIRW